MAVVANVLKAVVKVNDVRSGVCCRRLSANLPAWDLCAANAFSQWLPSNLLFAFFQLAVIYFLL